jgi:hypothetical protein
VCERGRRRRESRLGIWGGFIIGDIEEVEVGNGPVTGGGAAGGARAKADQEEVKEDAWSMKTRRGIKMSDGQCAEAARDPLLCFLILFVLLTSTVSCKTTPPP